MAGSFSYDRRALDRAVKDATKGAIGDLTKSTQSALDALHRQMSGQPVERVKPKLAQAWKSKMGEALTEPQLTEWATAIANGQRIVLRTS